VAWPRDPQGYHYGGGFLKLPTRDLAKLGYLYLEVTGFGLARFCLAATLTKQEPGSGPQRHPLDCYHGGMS
jgi:hypothetical protein